jgi:hypothetical protein
MLKLKTLSILAFLLILIKFDALCQADKIQVAFYNLENLFDTIDNANVKDGEFTPQGYAKWNSVKYLNKLEKLASVISGIGNAENTDGPAVLGVCEVENKGVLLDLTQQEKLKKLSYSIVHADSPDKRGIDVALLYQEKYFSVKKVNTHTLYLTDPITGERIYTRDQIVVSGKLLGEPTSFIVNHWPSRRGGQIASAPKRMAAAQLNRHIIDSLYAVDNLQNIIIMGDFNDDPDNQSITEYLKAKHDVHTLHKNDLFDGMYNLFKNGQGTLCYHDKWNLFDQIIITENLIAGTGTLKFRSVSIYNPDYLKQHEGRFMNYPFRTLAGSKYLGGYSDHFPVYMILDIKK